MKLTSKKPKQRRTYAKKTVPHKDKTKYDRKVSKKEIKDEHSLYNKS